MRNTWLTAAFYTAVLVMFFVFIGGPFVMGAFARDIARLPEPLIFLVSVIPHQTLMMCSVLAPLLIFGASMGFAGGLKAEWRPGWTHLAVTAAVFAVVFPLVSVVTLVFGELLKLFHISFAPPPLPLIVMKCKPLSLAVLLFGVIVLAPVSEELVFRRVIYGWLASRTGGVVALFLTAAMFAAVHQSLVQFPGLFILGVALQLLYINYDSIWPPVIFHAAQNSLSMLILLLFRIAGIELPPKF
jgi:membrane protease YdiL (CAAX protease family)